MSLSALALEIAASYVGTKETAPNSGHDIDLFLASVGLHPGSPWCSSFLFYCFETAAARLKLRNPYPRTGSSQRVWRAAEPFCRDSNPSVGAVYVLKHSETTGHVGIVESISELGVITSLSGNTFDGKGGRAGNCVARHVGQPEVVHHGELTGYLNLDLAAQAPTS